jgi:L-ascorbate metabolism protein UlaG (beta-lactamase superfamily)
MMHRLGVLASVMLAVGAHAQPSGVEVRYVANSGMLVTVSGVHFLIDAPIRDGIAPYATSPADQRARLEAARAPYDDVAAILVTHWHEDHFSAEAAAAHLSRNPRTIFISSQEVVDRVRAAAPSLPAAQTRAITPSPGGAERTDVRGVPVHVLRIRHNPSRRLPAQHVGFLLGSSSTVLHVGDADPAADNFTVLESRPAIDLALLPFWYLTNAANRQLVASSIRPGRIIAMHVPPQDAGKIEPQVQGTGIRTDLAATPGTQLADAQQRK